MRKRSKYRPRATNKSAWLEKLGEAKLAHDRDPLPRARQIQLIGRFGLALKALMTGQATISDMKVIGGAANISMALCEYGLGDIEVARAGQDVCVVVWARAEKLGRYVMTGEETRAMQALAIQHEAQIESEDCSNAVLVAAEKSIQRRQAAGHELRVEECT